MSFFKKIIGYDAEKLKKDAEVVSEVSKISRQMLDKGNVMCYNIVNIYLLKVVLCLPLGERD